MWNGAQIAGSASASKLCNRLAEAPRNNDILVSFPTINLFLTNRHGYDRPFLKSIIVGFKKMS
jgi:hypothetical protein